MVSPREDNYYSTYDSTFTTDIILDVRSSIGQNAIYAEIYNFGAGDIIMQIQSSKTFGNKHMLKAGTITKIERNIDKIRLEHSGTDSGYSVWAE